MAGGKLSSKKGPLLVIEITAPGPTTRFASVLHKNEKGIAHYRVPVNKKHPCLVSEGDELPAVPNGWKLLPEIQVVELIPSSSSEWFIRVWPTGGNGKSEFYCCTGPCNVREGDRLHSIPKDWKPLPLANEEKTSNKLFSDYLSLGGSLSEIDFGRAYSAFWSSRDCDVARELLLASPGEKEPITRPVLEAAARIVATEMFSPFTIHKNPEKSAWLLKEARIFAALLGQEGSEPQMGEAARFEKTVM
ncbi:MAG: hypothetical protein PHS02_00105 [Candidatus ainarchaeum sp.]|nr:hypothetical protein [Candidatus ainarchaeum sp.]